MSQNILRTLPQARRVETDFSIPARTEVNIDYRSGDIPKFARVYAYSPGVINVQVFGQAKGDYVRQRATAVASAHLTHEQVRQLIANLQDVLANAA
jgi:hypothetical protein